MDKIGKSLHTYFDKTYLIEDKDHMNRNLAIYDKAN